MDELPFTGSTIPLVRLAKVLYRRSSEEALGMRPRWFIALSYLRAHDSAPQQRLCEDLCIDANNVVLLLNSLEQEGLIRRRRDPADRRRHLVELTPAGRAALARADRAQERIEDEVLGALSGAQRRALRTLLARALAGLGEQREADAA